MVNSARTIVLRISKLNKMFPLSKFDIAEIICLLSGLFLYSSLRHSVFRWLVWLMLLVVVAELSGRYLSRVLHKPNAWIFNISTNIEFVIYSMMFYKTYTFRQFRQTALIFLCFYPVIAAINIIFIQGVFKFHSNTMSLGSLFMILFCCLFFYEILHQQKELDLLKTPYFWFATGILFFYTGDLLYNLFFSFLTINKYDYKLLFKTINNNLIILLYCCFISAFICKKAENKSS
jgi:hypothetical protein